MEMIKEGVSEDVIFGGRVCLQQPQKGYRVSFDPILLAAAVENIGEPQRVMDMGCGVGTVGFCVVARLLKVEIIGLDRQKTLVELALENTKLNEISGRVSARLGDVLEVKKNFAAKSFDVVMANPPYLKAEASRAPHDEGRAIANIEGAAKLVDWVEAAHYLLPHHGRFLMIHRADRLDDILAALKGKFGAVKIYPIWPHADKKLENKAKRIIICAEKDSHAVLELLQGLVLHEADGNLTTEAAAVIEDVMPLPALF